MDLSFKIVIKYCTCFHLVQMIENQLNKRIKIIQCGGVW